MVRFLAVVMGGLPALAPAPPALVMNPLMANVLGGLSADDVPFQEGWLKLRGIPFSVTKIDIIQFFTARHPHPHTACLHPCLPRCLVLRHLHLICLAAWLLHTPGRNALLGKCCQAKL